MEQHHPEPQPPVLSSVEGPTTQPTIRHDGWTGEKMAIFCETLAETGVVEEACEVATMGVSGAYAARRRSPIFAAAWQAALSIGRERLADRLLSRAIEGNVEQIYRDGELVGERHVIDNRLGLAILRRLDRLAETGQAVATRGANLASTPVRAERSRSASILDRTNPSTGPKPSTPCAKAMTRASPTRSPSPKVTKWRKWRTPRFRPVRVTISIPKATSPTAAGGTNPNCAG